MTAAETADLSATFPRIYCGTRWRRRSVPKGRLPELSKLAEQLAF